MKKAFTVIFGVLTLLIASASVSRAAEMEIITPSPLEMQIAPARDFYVVGRLHRSESAEREPLDIRIELSDEEGNIVRLSESRVEEDGVTSNQYILTDYEGGFASGDEKGINLYSYPPADVMYDGRSRDSVRLPSEKIVVRDSYFAAIIYGGAGKNYDLNYIDEHEMPLSDIEEGEYLLKAAALNTDGEEVCSAERTISVRSDAPRLIYNSRAVKEKDLQDFAELTGSSVVNSAVGYWHPHDFTSAPENFTYISPMRLFYNLTAEFGGADKVKLLLYAADLNERRLNLSLGGAAEQNLSPETTYFYYDIGEESVSFDLAGEELVKKGELVENGENTFVKLLRAQTYYNDHSYADFNPENGAVLTSGCETVFSGVYSPVNLSASRNNAEYTITDSASKIRAVITDKQNNTLYETECAPFVERYYADGTSYLSRYEFNFSVAADESMVSEECTLTVMLSDYEDKVIGSTSIRCAVKGQGAFIDGYTDSYWGKKYCDEINLFGVSPSGDAIGADTEISRGNFAAMINRLFGFAEKGGADFSDIDKTDVYYSDVSTAQAAHYMSGDEHARIKADNPITREEAIIALSRICNPEKGDFKAEFKDGDEISFWAEEEVGIMCSTGIITGFDGYLHPRENITAAEAAALICKTAAWMYRGSDREAESSAPKAPLIEFDTAELEDVALDSVSEAETVDRKELENFITNNLIVLDSLKNYVLSSCPDGIYVKRVGKGLEVREYRLGGSLALTEEAVRILTQLSERYPFFTLKYNPESENAVYFAFASDENKKEFGIAFSDSGESENKEMEPILGKWYYYNIK